MKVNFLLFFAKASNSDLHSIVTESLHLAYEDNYDESPDIDAIDTAIDIRYVRMHTEQQNNNEDQGHSESYIAGFSIDFDTEDENSGNSLVKAFCEQLADHNENGIKHVLKLNDPYLHMRNKRYANEIFEIEMKLREAISLIFLDTYGRDFYNLLNDVITKPVDGNLQAEQMQAHWENEFFYLLFSNYINLNERKLPKGTKGLIELIEQADDFEGFKRLLTSKPISDERYADFLASLKTHVDPIERLRNCVAHNRTIPQRVIDNYETAKQFLLKFIDDLIGYPIRDDVGLWWEEDAVKAMQQALAEADWDYDQGAVGVVEPDIGRLERCSTYEELLTVLTEIGRGVAYTYMPFEDGEPVFDFDDVGAAESVISKYKENLHQLGWEY